jgi:hypothetical protein
MGEILFLSIVGNRILFARVAGCSEALARGKAWQTETKGQFDLEVWAFKAKLRLQSGARILGA